MVGHPGAAEKGDMMDDVLFVKVKKQKIPRFKSAPGYEHSAFKSGKMGLSRHAKSHIFPAKDESNVELRAPASACHGVLLLGVPTDCCIFFVMMHHSLAHSFAG